MNKGLVVSLIPKDLAPKVGELKTRDGLRFVEPYSSLSILGHPCQRHATPGRAVVTGGPGLGNTGAPIDTIPGLWLLGLDWASQPSILSIREDRGVNILGALAARRAKPKLQATTGTPTPFGVAWVPPSTKKLSESRPRHCCLF